MNGKQEVVVLAPLFNRLPVEGYGAIERVTIEKVRALHRSGFKVQFVGPIDLFDDIEELLRVSKVFQYPTTSFERFAWLFNFNWTRYVHTFIKLRREIWRAPILSDAGAMDPLNNFFLAKNLGSERFLFFLHGNHYLTNGIGKFAFLPIDVLTNISKKMNYAVLNTRLYSYMNKLNYNVNYMPNGIDFPEKNKIVSKPEDYFVFIGAINRFKAPHLAIELANRLGTKLIIIGPKNDNVYYKQYIEPQLNSKIKYFGEIKRNELVEILRYAQSLIFTSIWNEPQGMVILEALSYGVPVLSLNSGYYSGNYDMIEQGKTGLIGDIEVILKHCEEIFSLDRYTVREKAFVKWSWDAVIKNYYKPVITKLDVSLGRSQK